MWKHQCRESVSPEVDDVIRIPVSCYVAAETNEKTDGYEDPREKKGV